MINWHLKEILETENITPYKLWLATDNQLNIKTIYRICNETPDKIAFDSLGVILTALNKVTQKHYKISDLMSMAGN